MASKFYNEQMVEHRAWSVLEQFLAKSGQSISIPVPVERIAEGVMDAGILWEPIPEPPGQTILAGLVPSERLIIFNETRRPLFDDTPYLYNTVLAHEIGHWELHVDKPALEHPLLPGFERPFQFVCRRADNSWDERHAHWFGSHLLLPRHHLATILSGVDIRSLADMYRLRDDCQVTITLLRIALERMGRGYVDENGHVHPSRQEYHGQARLF